MVAVAALAAAAVAAVHAKAIPRETFMQGVNPPAGLGRQGGLGTTPPIYPPTVAL